jgi:hypothetical protein
MAIGDIPVFREARRGQVVRSDDWNGVQRELRNGIRAHRHTRAADAPVNDAATEDLALQITTDEIADGAVTLAKLSPDALGGLAVADFGANVSVRLEDAGPGAARQAMTAVVSLPPRARERIDHGLGAVPVAIALGIRQDVPGLDGEFEIYGAAPEQGRVFAAVPQEPDGTFVLVSTARSEVAVRWWASAAATEAAVAAAAATEKARPTRRRRGR